MNWLYFLLCGAIGGLARGLLGAYKNSMNLGEKRKLNWGKMGLNIITATVVGAVVGLIVDQNPTLAATSGYVGIDVIDSLIKLTKSKH